MKSRSVMCQQALKTSHILAIQNQLLCGLICFELAGFGLSCLDLAGLTPCKFKSTRLDSC
jgi:hypothetical protein